MKPNNLPELKGSEKQITWATEIRNTALASIASIKLRPETPAEKVAQIQSMIDFLFNTSDASYWIEAKHLVNDSRQLLMEARAQMR